MGQAIVKAAKDRDLYLVWSSVVDAPIFIGDRESVLAELRGRETCPHLFCFRALADRYTDAGIGAAQVDSSTPHRSRQ